METTPKKKLPTQIVRVTLIIVIVGLAIAFLAPYIGRKLNGPADPIKEQLDSLAASRDSLKTVIDSLVIQADTLKKKPSELK